MSDPAPAEARFHAVVETAWGRYVVAWTARGLVAIDSGRVSSRRHGAAAPPRGAAREAVRLAKRYFEGESVDFRDLPIDWAAEPLTELQRRVYETARTIPRGSAASYGEVARRAGFPRAARAVGTAMKQNPFGLLVPCHRVIGAGGRIGGWSGESIARKQRLLALEGVDLGRLRAAVSGRKRQSGAPGGRARLSVARRPASPDRNRDSGGSG